MDQTPTTQSDQKTQDEESKTTGEKAQKLIDNSINYLSDKYNTSKKYIQKKSNEYLTDTPGEKAQKLIDGSIDSGKKLYNDISSKVSDNLPMYGGAAIAGLGTYGLYKYLKNRKRKTIE